MGEGFEKRWLDVLLVVREEEEGVKDGVGVEIPTLREKENGSPALRESRVGSPTRKKSEVASPNPAMRNTVRSPTPALRQN